MTVARRIPDQEWTAERFLVTDQHEFGDAWRYELVNGRIVAHAAPSPEHGAILAGLTCTRQPAAGQSGRLPAGKRQRRGPTLGTACDGADSRCADPLRRAAQGSCSR